MKKLVLLTLLFVSTFYFYVSAQNVMTPELLWSLGRISPETLTPDGKSVIYGLKHYDVSQNKGESNLYSISVDGGEPKQLTTSAGGENSVQFLANGKMGYMLNSQWWEANADGSSATQVSKIEGGISLVRISPDGKSILFSRDVKVDTMPTDRYPELAKTTGQEYNGLMYRHWTEWNNGTYQHIFYASYNNGVIGEATDIMKGEKFDCPQKPFGGAEDVIWSPDSKKVVYVCKKKSGTAYATSTNSDIYIYDLASGKTTDMTEANKGYDNNPCFSPDGKRIAWLSMARDGYEADKNRLMVADITNPANVTDLTKNWDESVSSFHWSNDGGKIYFIEPKEATEQIFEISMGTDLAKAAAGNFRQITNGDFDIDAIIGQVTFGNSNSLIVSRQDMNHATELFKVNITNGSFTPITQVNKKVYDNLAMGKIEKRWVKTTDNKRELVWVIYPPNFEPDKKYPTLLYCQGGPQSPVSQFYSYRWNFQLIAANGYIIVAPNRRGLQGFGTAWNEQISKDWGGQSMQDYLSAIDSISKLPFVDNNRRGCVGASYGGYSVYMLAGIHQNRFKTFIAHDGVFDLTSMYGTTEEMWFANWDMGGPYWDKNAATTYQKFNPINYVDKWNTPILVISNMLDFRVPDTQGYEAFQAAQLRGIKSRLLTFPDEGHWVVKPQNSLLWHHEFFRWLKETL